MNILSDKELINLVEEGHINLGTVQKPVDWYDENSPIQPASVDLHIGNIYLPEVDASCRGGVENPKTEYVLRTGETVLVETEEELDIPSDCAGFGFPPARLAVKGLLMTNPGHIDPGYKGRLKFTLINMGKEELPIRRTDIVFSTIWVRLQNRVEKDFSERRTGFIYSGPTENNMSKLSKDFLEVDKRAYETANEVASEHSKKAKIMSAIIALLFTVVTFFVSYIITGFHEERNNIIQNSKDIASLVAKQDAQYNQNSKDIDLLADRQGAQYNKDVVAIQKAIAKIEIELNAVKQQITNKKGKQ